MISKICERIFIKNQFKKKYKNKIWRRDYVMLDLSSQAYMPVYKEKPSHKWV
jgi:hypothetical protein